MDKKHRRFLATWQGLLNQFDPDDFPSHEIWAKVLGPRKKNGMGDFETLKPAKQRVVSKNRDFYARHKHIIKPWLKQIEEFDDTYKKLEWHVRDCERLRIKDHLIQFRASGIRVKTAKYAPALVAIGQVPIQGWNNRYLPLAALLKLQCFPRTHTIDGRRRSFKTLNEEKAMVKALGNAINVKVVQNIARALTEK